MSIRVLTILILALLSLPLAALPAVAACEVATVDQYPDTNYTTVCALEQQSFGDGTQTYNYDYTAHASHAVEADPAFDYAHANAEQGTWTYDDGTTQAPWIYDTLP